MPAYSRKLSKGVRWYYSGQYLGNRYFSRAIYLTKGEALKAERIRRNEIDEEIRLPKSEMRLKDLMDKRLDYIQLNKSNDYYKENRRYFRKALESWGNIPVTEVNRSMVNDLLMSEAKRLKKAGKSNYKVNSMIRSLKALFNWGIRIFDLN
ncbi:MAG: hypothetical protein GWN31_05885, partial [Candidatus Thorarchaeota archaeon]|nr:hypothetical protein [Candidatus Thorarchaeota archaeon]NIW13457.1 hypothetical protein [Candidatus Thorarchaeota archaeon]NIW51567.1 hypothetical protein [Candidatus Korarchaeota archaeon]